MDLLFDGFHQCVDVVIFLHVKQDEHVFVVIAVQRIAEEVGHDR